MWNENEIDMEELEAHLYGQIHHPSTEDYTVPSSNDLPSNNMQEDSSYRYGQYKRYFNEYRMREPMCNFKTGYQESTYFKKPTRYPESNINNTNFQHLPNLPNVYGAMGYVPEIALNNIVVLPPPASPHIFVQPEPSPQDIAKIRKKEKRREKRKAKRALLRNLLRWQGNRNNNDNSETKTFREHRLTRKPINTSQEDDNDCEFIPQEDENAIICLSESDGSDCEITVRAEEPAIVLSSDDEENVVEKLYCEIKSEKSNNDIISNNRNDLKKEDKLEIVNITSKDDNQGDDDEVVLIESRNEIIEISCDDSQTISGEKPVATSDSYISHSLDNSDNLTAIPTLINKESIIRPGTPESTTNDFLENSFSESNDVNTGCSLNIQKLNSDVCETESTSSTSDTEIPSRTSAFIEHDFDVPSQELNLDSFADFIGSGNTNSENAANLNNPKFQSSTPKTSKGNKNKTTTEKNSSDSSSESDYEDNKSTMIKTGRPKKKRALSLRSRSSSGSSPSDCCIVDNNSKMDENNLKTDKIGTPLPNLSPITSDEEVNNSEKSKKKEPKRNKKRKSTPPQETSTSGEKRKYPQEILEYLKAKRLKENKKKDVMCASSDELSEVEVTHSPEKKKLDSPSETVINISSTTSKEPALFRQSGDSTRQHSKSFKDYWTEDMKKFYFESWGHEDFSVEKAQENMPDSPELWKIIPSDQAFMQSRARGQRCVRCNEFGHKSIVCKAKPKPLRCSICGGVGHAHTRCPKSLCTSCGRKNYCFTTYCSRCANSRRIVCRLCSQYGHIDSRCPDLWRRYHLTTKAGPLVRPFNSSLIPKQDRWCSGCASRGHFEHECNYYNRTHASNDPSICNYSDVYDRKGSSTPRTETQTSTSNDHTPPHPNPYSQNISNSPWIVTNFQTPYMHNQNQSPYMHNQEQNIFQQFPILQSVPSILTTLQQGSNFFYQNPNFTFSNQFIPQNIGGNAFQHNQQLSNSPLKNYNAPEENQQQSSFNNDQQTKHYLDFKGRVNGTALLSQQGSDFLKVLGNTTNVKINVAKQRKNSKITYLCTLEGPRQQLVDVGRKITEFVNSYTSKSSGGLTTFFKGKAFSLEALQDNLGYLDDRNTNWIFISSATYKRIKQLNKEVCKLQTTNLKKAADTQKSILKQLYVSINSVLIGKLLVENGDKHMAVLRKYNSNKNLNVEQMRMLEESYNYVFRNSKKLNINYGMLIDKLPSLEGADLKGAVDDMYKSGIDVCKKCKDTQSLENLRKAYKVVVRHKYKVGPFLQLKDIFNKIMKMDRKQKHENVNRANQ